LRVRRRRLGAFFAALRVRRSARHVAHRRDVGDEGTRRRQLRGSWTIGCGPDGAPRERWSLGPRRRQPSKRATAASSFPRRMSIERRRLG